MKILIKYSSGTGNTGFIANELQKHLIKMGHQVESSNIENEAMNSEFDMLIIGGPIYAGNVPEKLIRYVIGNIPDAKNKKAIVYTTSTGLLNAHGVLSISKKLHNKGYDVVSNERFVLPRNYYFGHYSPMEDEYCKKLFMEAGKQVKLLVETLKNNNFTRPEIENKEILSKDLMAELFSVMAKFMGKSFRANQNCTLCMKCVKNCPQKNIKRKNDKIRFGFNCMMCTRCIHGCPSNAIEYSKKIYKQYDASRYM